MKKSPKKNKIILYILFLLIYVSKCFSQVQECETVFYANNKTVINDEIKFKYKSFKNIIYFNNDKNIMIYFVNDKLYIDNKKIFSFKNVQYYEYLVYLKKDNKEYIYIYPHYNNSSGPYIWIELGVLVEINTKRTILKDKINYYDYLEICDVVTQYNVSN